MHPVANFTDKANLDRSDAVLRIYQDLQQVNAPNANLILGETATSESHVLPSP